MTRRKSRKTAGEVIEVLWLDDDTVTTDSYTARRASTQVWDGGRALLKLTGGYDGQGSVSAAHYTHVQRIIRRPTKESRP